MLAFHLQEMKIGSYTLSGDNYPHKIPKYNDAERLRIFRESAIRGMIVKDEYNKERFEIIHELQLAAEDANIWLKRMGREETQLWYDSIDFTNIHELIIEWTHGNSDYYEGVDIPILLNSTPEETLAHR
ncbi:MAG: hypothetical protein ACERKZ_13495 [Lachnotalea sp.]